MYTLLYGDSVAIIRRLVDNYLCSKFSSLAGFKAVTEIVLCSQVEVQYIPLASLIELIGSLKSYSDYSSSHVNILCGPNIFDSSFSGHGLVAKL